MCLSVGSLATSRTRRPPARKPAQAVPIQSQVHNKSAPKRCGSSSRSMESGLPDCGFGRCDGHHKMIDFRLEKNNGTAASWISVCGECGGRGQLLLTFHTNVVLWDFCDTWQMFSPDHITGRFSCSDVAIRTRGGVRMGVEAILLIVILTSWPVSCWTAWP